MVRNYKRRKVTEYSEENLNRAVEAVKNKQMTSYAAAEKFGIPRSTIIHRLYGKRGAKQLKPGKPTAFSIDEETKMASYIHVMEKCGYPLTKKDVRSLVSEYIRRNGILTPFKDGIPGDDWFQSFRKRHNLSIKKPQSVEVARRKACNPFTVFEYFGILEEITKELDLTAKPGRIYNLDETSFSNDPSKSKVFGKKGFRSTRTTSSPGRDNTTVLLAANALGEKIPPLIIFQGKHLWSEWMYKNDTVNTAYAVSSKGWMETSIFEKYIKDVFIPAIGPERPVLLIFDGHATHVDLNVIKLAAANDITILKLPAHSSDVLQPLDCSTMKPMKDRWDTELVKWQRLHVGAKLPKQEFARIITYIWDDLNPVIIANGFKKSGIYPVNRNAIPKEKFDALSWSKWENFVKEQPNKPVNEIPPSNMENIEEIHVISTRQNTIPTLSNLVLSMFNFRVQEQHVLQEKKSHQIENRLTLSAPNKREKSKSEFVKEPKTYVLPLPIIPTNKTVFLNHLKILDTKIVKPAENKENYDVQSFERILLQSIARNDPPKNPKKRINSGAEVLTYKSAIERMQKEKEEKEEKQKNKPKKRETKNKVQKTTKPAILKKKPRKIESSDSDSTGSYHSTNDSDNGNLDDLYQEYMEEERMYMDLQELEKQENPEKKERVKQKNRPVKKANQKKQKTVGINSLQVPSTSGKPTKSKTDSDDVPLSSLVCRKQTKKHKKESNLCYICSCDYRFYRHSVDWICCITCKNWVCGMCNKGSTNPSYECVVCEDDSD